MNPLPRLLFLLVAVLLICGCSPDRKKNGFLAAGDTFFKAGEYEKAKSEYQKVLKIDRAAAPAIQKLGIIYQEQGAPLQALPFLLKARASNPEDYEARKHLALCFVAIGARVDARKEALEILAKHPDHAEALLILADTAQSQKEIEETEAHLEKVPESQKAATIIAGASLELRKGDAPAAEAALKRAIELDPKAYTPHFALGSVYTNQNRIEEAGKELELAAQLAPPRSPASIRFADFKAKTGKLDEAQAILEKVCSETPDYLPAWSTLARFAFSKKDFDRALALVEKILGYDANNFDARILQSQILLAQGNAAKAVETLETLNRAYPNLPGTNFQLGVAYLAANKPDQAAASLKQVVQANPGFDEAVLLLAELNLRQGEAEAVASSMSNFVRKRPGHRQAQVLLASALWSQGKLEEAEKIVREAQASGDSAQLQTLLALILGKQNKGQESRAALESALQLAPGDERIIASLVDLDLAEKKFDAALQRAEAQIGKLPNSPAAHFTLARVRAAQGEWDLAEAALLKALELDPNYTRAYWLLVTTYMSARKIEPALAQLDAILAKAPDNLQALMTSALIREQQGGFAQAAQAYERLIAAHSGFAPAYNNLAMLYLEKLEQPDKALELAKKARELDGEDPSVADTLGWVHFKRGEYQSALALLQDSAAKLPTHPEIQFHLGMASYMMGQEELSRVSLAAAAQMQVSPAIKAEIDRRLGILQAPQSGAGEQEPAFYEGLLAQDPNDVVARMRLGATQERLKDFPKAAATYETALKVNPNLLSAVLRLAQLNAGELKNPEKAIELGKRARALAPADAKVAAILGKVAYDAGDIPWAFSLLQESVREVGPSGGALHTLAWATYRLGQVGSAEQMMQRVLNEDPDTARQEDAKLFLKMVALNRKQDELLAAGDEIQGVLGRDPAFLPAQLNQAALHAARGAAKEASELYQDILTRSPDFAPAQKALAVLSVDSLNQPDRARELATKARKTLPDDPELVQILATVQYKKKEYTAALDTLKELSRAKPLDARSLFVLGMCQMQLGQKSESRQSLNQALEAGLKDPFARDAKWVLKTLESQSGTLQDLGTGSSPL